MPKACGLIPDEARARERSPFAGYSAGPVFSSSSSGPYF